MREGTERKIKKREAGPELAKQKYVTQFLYEDKSRTIRFH